MAAVATDTITIKINDIDVQVPKGELIVESVKRLGLEIPIFCYHPRMKPVGMCRMCIVEVGFIQADGSVRKMPKPQAACTLPAQENMVVYTDSEMVHRDRKGVLEFLLVNHPLDCPICDRGGECPLQNNTLFYGPSTSRFIELKRHAPKAFPLSKYVTLDLERCIQCGRCVRFTEEISGDSELAFRFRGSHMQPSTFELRDFTSKFSGNVIEICPVGALTNREYRFRARPWDLQTKPAICTVCSNGCNVWFDYRVGQMVRINARTNDGVNEEWTCDKGKFGHEFYNSQDRLTKPLIRQGDRLVECDWPTAYTAILEAFQGGGQNVAGLASHGLSNEDLYVFKQLFAETFGSSQVDTRWHKESPSAAETQKLLRTPTRIADLETKSSILIFGSDLSDELPIVYLRCRKAWFSGGAKVVVAHWKDTDADSFAHLLLRYKQGTSHALAKGLLAAASGDDSGVKAASEETGVPAERLKEAVECLKENSAMISSRQVLDHPDGVATLRALSSFSDKTGSPLNCYATGANEQGAQELAFLAEDGAAGGRSILDACAHGKIRALWLAGTDPFELEDPAKVNSALEHVDFLVVQALAMNEALPFASVVLPMTAPAEQDGSYVNCERRVQRLAPVIGSKGESKPVWRVSTELLLRSSKGTPYFSAADVFDKIASEHSAFQGLSLKTLPDEGGLLG